MQTLLAWLVVLGGGLLLLAVGARPRRAAIAVVGASVLVWTFYGLALAPSLDASSSARKLMHEVHVRIGSDAELGLVAWREQHLLQAVRSADHTSELQSLMRTSYAVFGLKKQT